MKNPSLKQNIQRIKDQNKILFVIAMVMGLLIVICHIVLLIIFRT